MMRFFSVRRKRNEDMMTWLSRFDISLAEAGSHGLTMSILATNFLTMFWGGMSMQDIVNALAPVRGKIPDTEVATTELRSFFVVRKPCYTGHTGTLTNTMIVVVADHALVHLARPLGHALLPVTPDPLAHRVDPVRFPQGHLDRLPHIIRQNLKMTGTAPLTLIPRMK